MSTKLKYILRKAAINDADGITKVSVASWKRAYKNIIDQEFLDSISHKGRLEARVTKFWANGINTFVAESDGDIIGFCDFGESRNPEVGTRGEILAIYVLEEFYGYGVGYELWKAATNELRKQGLTPFHCWGLEGNKRALEFYERQGGKAVRKVNITIGDKEYPEVCYAFEK